MSIRINVSFSTPAPAEALETVLGDFELKTNVSTAAVSGSFEEVKKPSGVQSFVAVAQGETATMALGIAVIDAVATVFETASVGVVLR